MAWARPEMLRRLLSIAHRPIYQAQRRDAFQALQGKVGNCTAAVPNSNCSLFDGELMCRAERTAREFQSAQISPFRRSRLMQCADAHAMMTSRVCQRICTVRQGASATGQSMQHGHSSNVKRTKYKLTVKMLTSRLIARVSMRHQHSERMSVACHGVRILAPDGPSSRLPC